MGEDVALWLWYFRSAGFGCLVRDGWNGRMGYFGRKGREASGNDCLGIGNGHVLLRTRSFYKQRRKYEAPSCIIHSPSTFLAGSPPSL